MKKKVLVFPCGSEIGIEVHKSIKHSIHFELIGLSSVADHGKFVYEKYIEIDGFFTDIDFIHNLNSIIEELKIDIVYPTMDSVISFMVNSRCKINAKIVGPSSLTARVCESKLETYNTLRGVVKCPKIFNQDSHLNLPLFLKPIIGYGSRNSFKINSKSQLLNVDMSKNILTEYLPGQEFTVDCFTGINRELLFVGARNRSRTMNGISVNTKSDSKLTLEFIHIAEKLNSTLEFNGAWFFQMKKDKNDELTLLEIACRFAGSSSVHRIKGVNFALANLYLTEGVNPEFLINTFDVELDRSLDSVYKIDVPYNQIFIDLDDTIIIDDKINTEAISLIFQARNQNIKLILVTKHKSNLADTLNRFRLEGLFDEIIHVEKGQEKSEYLFNRKYKNSIFIDDSFSERKKVFDRLKIPVFGLDSISSLIKS
jgi:predicted ATP-grasp superfamily ATP-dependent carboligase